MTQTLPANKLAARPTPYYIYDIGLLQQTIEQMQTEMGKDSRYHMHYAIKANANPCVLQPIKDAGMGIDCVSGGEIETAINAGFAPSAIYFAGVGKADWEINLGLERGIGCFNVESVPELEVISQLAQAAGKVANICLRINPNVGAHTHANIVTGLSENKFGIDMAHMDSVISLAQSLPGIHLIGLHFHIGSQILDMGDFIALCHRINELQDQLEARDVRLKVINVGGGLGIDYDSPMDNPIPDFAAFFATYRQHLNLREGQELHFELGRAIVAQCGTLITRVLYVKDNTDKKFVIVDAGMTELIRPALYEARHAIVNLSSNQATETYDVVGPICESSDVFATDIKLPLTTRGDIIAILSAGAYGETMASCYNQRPLPKSYTVADIMADKG